MSFPKEFNENSKSSAWPIPNIREMFARIGEHRSKHFAVLELMSGYHQIEVANPSRALTAFSSNGAPTYFQCMMSGIMLHGLVFFICEINLDDCLVFGKSEDELIENL